jgi:hypothetical protein
MVDAFATYVDLGLRLNRTFTSDEQPWISQLLSSASTYLRDTVLGQQVYPQATVTFVAYPDGGDIVLPQSPVVSVGNVTDSVGLVLDVTRRDNTLTLVRDNCDRPVSVTFTYGYTVAPDSLTDWTCVLVSQMLLTLAQNLGLNAGGLSSIAIDDFKTVWANAGAESGFTLSDRNIELLRAQFGVRGSTVVGQR